MYYFVYGCYDSSSTVVITVVAKTPERAREILNNHLIENNRKDLIPLMSQVGIGGKVEEGITYTNLIGR